MCLVNVVYLFPSLSPPITRPSERERASTDEKES